MEDYKLRLITEYRELKERYMKLHRTLVRWEAGTIEFVPTCPRELLKRQAEVMYQYLTVLEIRAERECVPLEDDAPKAVEYEQLRIPDLCCSTESTESTPPTQGVLTNDH